MATRWFSDDSSNNDDEADKNDAADKTEVGDGESVEDLLGDLDELAEWLGDEQLGSELEDIADFFQGEAGSVGCPQEAGGQLQELLFKASQVIAHKAAAGAFPAGAMPARHPLLSGGNWLVKRLSWVHLRVLRRLWRELKSVRVLIVCEVS